MEKVLIFVLGFSFASFFWTLHGERKFGDKWYE